jgi:hypothetical protein
MEMKMVTVQVPRGWWDMKGAKAREQQIQAWLDYHTIPHQWSGDTARRLTLSEGDHLLGVLAGVFAPGP